MKTISDSLLKHNADSDQVHLLFRSDNRGISSNSSLGILEFFSFVDGLLFRRICLVI